MLVDEKTAVNLVVSLGPGPAAQIQSIELLLPEEQDFYKVVIKVKDVAGSVRYMIKCMVAVIE